MTNHEFSSDKIKKSDEYYTKQYAIIPLLKYLEKGKTIWCPFDKEDSNYVKIFQNEGFKVIFGHIEDGKDFFRYVPEDYDYIISNPPYSLREKILERLFSLKKPFAMLINISGLFDSRKRFDLFRNNNFEIMVFNKRIDYVKPFQKDKKSSPPFSSIYICSELLPSKFVFEELNRLDTIVPPSNSSTASANAENIISVKEKKQSLLFFPKFFPTEKTFLNANMHE